MKFRKKPVVIEAVQWTGLNLEEIKEFVDDDSLYYSIVDTAWEVGKGAPYVIMKIHTLEGDHDVFIGDWIIKGVQGEFYPCKPDIFKITYECVDYEKCEYLHVSNYQQWNGIIQEMITKQVYECWGTREREVCPFNGDKSKCNK